MYECRLPPVVPPGFWVVVIHSASVVSALPSDSSFQLDWHCITILVEIVAQISDGSTISQEYIDVAYYRLYHEQSFVEESPNESVHSRPTE